MSIQQNTKSIPMNASTNNILNSSVVHHIKQMAQVLIGLIVIYSTFWLLAPGFRNVDTLLTILTQASVLGILACGTTIVLISGGLDLSVGSIFAVVGVVVGIALSIFELPVWLAVVIGLSTGTLCGFINGMIQVKTGVPAFIVTLGGLTAYKGVAELLAAGKDLSQFPESFHVFGSGYVMPTLIMFGCAIFVGIFLRKTRMGNHTYAIGGNEEIARLSGVNVAKSRVIYYMLGGLMAAMAAIVQVSRLDFAQSSRGVSYELFAIAAVVIGGTSLFGGRGGVSRTIIGMLIMQTIIVGLAYLGVGTSVQRIAIGVIIVLAVWLDVWQGKKH
jgi:ribose/xylose/arabinose/galactoside ABC-type transport system permease subunit